MSEPQTEKQPWAFAIGLLVVCAVVWLIALSGAFEASSAPQNLILITSKFGTFASMLWIAFLAVLQYQSRKK